jgi:hypothetical protein
MGGNKNQTERNQADHKSHINHWAKEKKASGQWLSKGEYEKKTGKPGRSQ